jgi:hypothetical protein
MRHTAKTIYPLTELYLEGSQSQNVFCESHDLSLSVLNYWISKYRQIAFGPSHRYWLCREPTDMRKSFGAPGGALLPRSGARPLPLARRSGLEKLRVTRTPGRG